MRRNRYPDAASSERLEEALSWFRTNLRIPKTFTWSRLKGRDNAEFTAGLSWFKEDATRVIARAFDLIALMREHDYQTEIIRTDRVGYIICEDEDQVVAEPFADTPV